MRVRGRDRGYHDGPEKRRGGRERGAQRPRRGGLAGEQRGQDDDRAGDRPQEVDAVAVRVEDEDQREEDDPADRREQMHTSVEALRSAGERADQADGEADLREDDRREARSAVRGPRSERGRT
ncbi:MAG: hypothetical protein E6J52_12555, partial [Chloroflexi bacterium]